MILRGGVYVSFAGFAAEVIQIVVLLDPDLRGRGVTSMLSSTTIYICRMS